MRGAIVLLTLAAGGCAAGLEPGAAATPVQLTADQTYSVDKGVRSNMKDPGAAKVSRLAAAMGADGQIHVCGYVSGKNSSGAYEGDRLFYGVFLKDSQTFQPVSVGDSAKDADAVSLQCRKHAVPM